VGALCPTPASGPGSIIGEEDCLYLNVWTPDTAAAQPRAVLVYIPGGGFVAGGASTPSFNGTFMAGAGDVVVVAMNYRLGALGFLRYLEGGAGIPGNFGIKDQILALRWVRDNIASFGGDPRKVTLFGESAGAMSTGLHLFAIPESTDLFRAAIMESNVMSVPYADPVLAAQRGAAFVAEYLCGVPGAVPSCARDAAWLRGLPLEAVMKAQIEGMPPGGMPGLLSNGMALGMRWAPTAGVAPVVGQADTGFHPGSSPKPYAFGFNRNEGFFFVPEPEKFTAQSYARLMECNFGPNQAERIRQFTANGRRPYDPDSYRPDSDSGMSPAAQALAWVITDYAFGAGNLRSAQKAWDRMRDSGLPVYGYYFTQASTFNFTGLRRCGMSTGHACHTDELPYVFHNLLAKDAGDFSPAKNVSREEEKLAEKMALAWSRFARDPFARLVGWVGGPLASVTGGPYVEWATPISTVNDLGTRVHYDFWSTIEAGAPTVAQSCSPAAPGK
jgi:carboxylesterase type B